MEKSQVLGLGVHSFFSGSHHQHLLVVADTSICLSLQPYTSQGHAFVGGVENSSKLMQQNLVRDSSRLMGPDDDRMV